MSDTGKFIDKAEQALEERYKKDIELQILPIVFIKTLQDYATDRLNDNKRLHYLGRGNNLGIWSSRPKGSPNVSFIELFKPMGGKDIGVPTIVLHEETENGLYLSIKIHLPSYCEEYTFFEGWIETKEDFDRVMVMVGLRDTAAKKDDKQDDLQGR